MARQLSWIQYRFVIPFFMKPQGWWNSQIILNHILGMFKIFHWKVDTISYKSNESLKKENKILFSRVLLERKFLLLIHPFVTDECYCICTSNDFQNCTMSSVTFCINCCLNAVKYQVTVCALETLLS